MKKLCLFTIMLIFSFTSVSFAETWLQKAIRLRTNNASNSNAGNIQDSLPQASDTADAMRDRARNITLAQILDRIEDNIQIAVPNNPDPSPASGGGGNGGSTTSEDGRVYDSQGKCVSGPFSRVVFEFGKPWAYGWPLEEGTYYINPCTGATEIAYDRKTAAFTCCCTFNLHPPYDTIICPDLFANTPGICSTVQCSSSYSNLFEDTPGSSGDFADFANGISGGSYMGSCAVTFTNFQYNPPNISPGLSGMDKINAFLNR